MSQLRTVMVVLALGCLVVGGCGGDEEAKGGAEGESCFSDEDCRLELLCEEQECVSQGQDPQPEATPDPQPEPPMMTQPGEPSDPVDPTPAPADPTIECDSDDDCPDEMKCFRQGEDQFCVTPCFQEADCPRGLSCLGGACL
jgi:hypothetical protein